MKRLFILFFLLLANGSALAFDADCGDPNSGSTIVSSCILNKNNKEMEKQLNAKYDQVLKAYQVRKATKEATLLIEAQRAWIRYRDAVCAFEEEEFGGIAGISLMRCMERITDARLKELEQL